MPVGPGSHHDAPIVVFAMLAYLALQSPGDGPLFHFALGKAMTRPSAPLLVALREVSAIKGQLLASGVCG